jgi:hypothetical protein
MASTPTPDTYLIQIDKNPPEYVFCTVLYSQDSGQLTQGRKDGFAALFSGNTFKAVLVPSNGVTAQLPMALMQSAGIH